MVEFAKVGKGWIVRDEQGHELGFVAPVSWAHGVAPRDALDWEAAMLTGTGVLRWLPRTFDSAKHAMWALLNEVLVGRSRDDVREAHGVFLVLLVAGERP